MSLLSAFTALCLYVQRFALKLGGAVRRRKRREDKEMMMKLRLGHKAEADDTQHIAVASFSTSSDPHTTPRSYDRVVTPPMIILGCRQRSFSNVELP